MERLTKTDEYGFSYYLRCFSGACDGLGCKNPDTCDFALQACNRLAAYEDTGLEPGEIPTGLELANVFAAMQELKRYEDSKEQGLLVRLPCKVGDTVYEISDSEIYEMTVVSFEIDECTCVYLSEDVNYGADSYDFTDFGESIFLTREAAEAALAEMTDTDTNQQEEILL